MTKTEKEKDLTIPCPDLSCLAETGIECTCTPLVHFGRRLKRLLIEKRADLLNQTN